ncbi:MAG: wax ester/triacylglycerol synthase family O-acyltransferase [Beijerinckiaceae bacterium]
MPNLSAIDLAMFLLETPERPANVGPLLLLRPPKSASENFAERLRANMMKCEPGPPFNYRLNMSLTRMPRVEPMASSDLSAHVHRLTLKGDGTIDELLATVCELHEKPLPREGLLWQHYIIDGLADGRVALYGKVHHGIIDGRSGVQVLAQSMSADPADIEVRPMWVGLPASNTAPREQSALISVDALLGVGKAAYAVVSAGVSLFRILLAQGMRYVGLGEQALDLPYVGVPDVLTGPASSKRNFAFTTLPLQELKSLSKATDATINDLLLAVLDGAMSRYLASQSKRPKKPLVVDMPVALSGASGANQIAVLQFAIGKAGTTMQQRLAAIRKETARVKAVVSKNSAGALMFYSLLAHAIPTLQELLGVRRPLRLSNLVFTNPFGFTGRQYLMGAEVELALPIAVIPAGQMLTVAALTLGDKVQLAFLGIPGAIDRISDLAKFTREAFEQLKTELQPEAGTDRAKSGSLSIASVASSPESL